MNVKKSNHLSQQRGLRLTKPHAEELVNLYGRAHAESESFHSSDLLLINYAHIVMLCKQNLISQAEAAQILTCIHKLETRGVTEVIHIDPHVGDLTTHMEAYIIEETGPEIGGKVHTGRSRNDLYVTMTKMLIRRTVLDVYEALMTLETSLLSMAYEHRETIMPGYTQHSQHAQPITLGYYFLGNFDVFNRDLHRLEDLWSRLNTCPMGAAALAGTGFPLDRAMVATLLGFDSVHEHAYDAVSSRDFLLEYLFILSSIASDLGRMAENILYWNTFEFNMIVLSDEYTSFSTIMPQKKNPVALETLRAFNAVVAGKLFNALGILKAEPWSNGRETTILDDDSVDLGKRVQDMIHLFNSVLRTMSINKERMLELARRGFSVATELADMLVRENGLPFRTAHEIVGLVVRKAVDSGLDSTQITADMVEEAAGEHLSKKITMDSEALRRALDPRENVEMRSLHGGPAVKEVTRMIEQRNLSLGEREEFLRNRRQQLDRAHEQLRRAVHEMTGGDSS